MVYACKPSMIRGKMGPGEKNPQKEDPGKMSSKNCSPSKKC